MLWAGKFHAAESLRYEYHATDGMRLESVRRPAAMLESIGDITLNDRPISDQFFRVLPPLYADFLDIAIYVYLADRFSLRKQAGDRDSTTWGRSFLLNVPVRCPEAWASVSVLSALRHVLNEFTEDDWDFTFIQKRENFRESESQMLLTELFGQHPCRVALFSGGLDSFAGTVHALTESPAERFVLVSGATHGRQAKDQRELVHSLQSASSAVIRHLSVTYGIRRIHGRPVEEKSQRSRGFLYLALGAVTALMAKTDHVDVFENGIGAINLRYNATQLGTANTRAMNPVALAKMEHFIRILSGMPFRIVDPFLFSTKGEICAHPSFAVFAGVAHKTFSCDGYPHRIKGVTQCGVCTSCLLRRLSLQVAGLGGADHGEFYNTDLGQASNTLSSDRLRALRLMDRQARRFALLLGATDPAQAFFAEYPELHEVVEVITVRAAERPEIVTQKILSLYQRYVNEWQSFTFLKLLEPAPMVSANAVPTPT